MWGAGAVFLSGLGPGLQRGTRCQLNSPVTLRPQGSGFRVPAQLGRVVWLTLGGEGGSPPGGAQPHPAVLLPLSQGMSETFETLHNLVHKGVKVVMDIPYELWNETSAEVADLKKQVPRPVGLVLSGCSDLVGWSGAGRVSKGALLGAKQGQDLWQKPGPGPATPASVWSWALLSALVRCAGRGV